MVARIGAIRGDLPAYLDLSSVSAWTAVVDEVLDTLTTLIVDARFQPVDPAAVERLRAWSATAAVRWSHRSPLIGPAGIRRPTFRDDFVYVAGVTSKLDHL